jgi:hypothetical protein
VCHFVNVCLGVVLGSVRSEVERNGGKEGTSSPSIKGRFMALAMNCATVLFPQPAGPVISQI